LKYLLLTLFIATPLLGQVPGERRSHVPAADSGDVAQLAWDGLRALLNEADALDEGAIGAELFRSVPGIGLGGRALLRDGAPASSARRSERGIGLNSAAGRETLGRPSSIRGPGAALFTTDLAGGATNLRTAMPTGRDTQADLSGSVGYSYGVEREQHRPWGQVGVGSSTWLLQGGGAWRSSAESDDGQQVDRTTASFGGAGAVRLGKRHELALRYDGYRGDRTLADQRAGDGPPISRTSVQPRDDSDRLSLRYQWDHASLGIADEIGVTLWGLRDVTDESSRMVITYDRPAITDATIVSLSHARARAGGARLDAQVKPFDRVRLSYGGSLGRERVDGEDSTSFTLTRSAGADLTRSETGLLPQSRSDHADLFAAAAIGLGDRLGLVVSGRHEWQRIALDDSSVSWNYQVSAAGAGLRYQPSRHWGFEIGGTLSGRAPSASDLLSRGVSLRGNGYVDSTGPLQVEHALLALAGVRYSSRQLIVSASMTGGSVSDAIRMLATGDTLLGIPIYRRTNAGRLRQYGGELTSIVPVIGPLHLLVSAGWSRNETVDDEWRDAVRAFGALSWPDREHGRFFSYEVLFRSGASTDDPHLPDAGLPDLMLHNVRGRVRLYSVGGTAHSAGIAVTNLFDEQWEGSAAAGVGIGLGREFLLSYRVDF
jgi:hypothetical protein